MSKNLFVDIILELEKFTLQVHFKSQGKITGLFGPSGSGKSSLLESIAGIRKKTTGEIKFNEVVWQDSKVSQYFLPEKRKIGFVPQDILLFPHLNVLKNMLCGVKKNKVESYINSKEVFKILELDSLLDRHIDSLSGGEKQRVALGRALCSSPQLLLLDEPLASLDIGLRRSILPYIKEILDKFSIPAVIVSHDPFELMMLCDNVIALNRGRVIAQGPAHQIFSKREVFPLASALGLENLIPCTVKSNSGGEMEVEIGQSLSVKTKPGEISPGTNKMLGIAAHEIFISTQILNNISARNCLSGKIIEIESLERVCITSVAIPEVEIPVLVEITNSALLDLGLKIGTDVYLIFKSRSTNLY